MPKITPQTGSAPVKPLAKRGSVLAEAIPVSQVEDIYIKMLIYGQNRVGKTTLACDFPKPMLLIGFEPNVSGGALSVKKIKGVQYLRLQSSAKAVQLANELRGGTDFATVVIDSATSYQDIILTEILKLPAVPEQLNWGMVSRDEYRQRSEKTREALRPFLNLPCHVVITAKERDHNPPDKDKPEILQGFHLESFLAADLGGATVGWLHDACDYIGRLSIEKEFVKSTVRIGGKDEEITKETGKLERRLRTMYHPNYAAGFRSSNPSSVPEYIVDPSYEKIAAVINS